MRLIFTLLLLLAAMTAFAGVIDDPDLLALLHSSPTTKTNPSDDAVWLLRDTDITVSESGVMTVRERKLVKLLTEQALPLAQWAIPYDKSTTTLEVVKARTLYADRAFDVEAGQTAESAIYPGIAWYDSLVVRRFPLPAAAAGAVLEVETISRRATPRLPGDLSARLALQQSYPIREANYTVRVPAGWRLAIRFQGTLTPKVDERVAVDSRIYTWSVHDVPALRVTEGQTPPLDDLVASVRIAKLTSWAPVAAWYAGLTAGKDTLTDDLRAVATRLTKDCTTDAAKIAALHKAVREIPYVAMEMGSAGDTPHSADEVLHRNYGDCKDKATLLRAMLRAVGIAGDYVLVRTTDRGALDHTLYGPAEFNHVILAVALPAGDRFLDATSADVPADLLPPGVEGGEGLIIRGDGTLVALPVSSAARNLTDVKVTVNVKADGSATGKAVLTLDGQQAIVQRGLLQRVKPDQYTEALQPMAALLGADAGLTSAGVEHLREPERPLVVTVEFSTAAYLQEGGPQLSGTLPWFMYQPNRYLTVKTRTYPFLLRLESRLHLEAAITLPDSLQVTFLPAPVQYTGPPGTYQDACRQEGATVHYTCDLSTKRGQFPPAMLDEFRAWSAILALEKRNGLQFYVKRTEKATK